MHTEPHKQPQSGLQHWALSIQHSEFSALCPSPLPPSLSKAQQTASGLRPSTFDLRLFAFTLIELITVMGIMSILLAMAVGASLDWGRSAGRRAAILNTRSSLQIARQFAVTHGEQTIVSLGNTNAPQLRGYLSITRSQGDLIANTNYLPRGFLFDTDEPFASSVTFASDGSCISTGNLALLICEARDQNFLAATLTVHSATGFVKEEP